MTELAGWENFYVIVGSSAGALIGLQFVVITLISDMPIAPGRAQARLGRLSTPTIVHFGTVLLLSAIVSAPWHGIGTAAVLWAVLGLAGIVYEVSWFGACECNPCTRLNLKTGCFMFSCPLRRTPRWRSAYADSLPCARGAMFVAAAAALLLLFIGIHNAWDAVTYHVFVNRYQAAARSAKMISGLQHLAELLSESIARRHRGRGWGGPGTGHSPCTASGLRAIVRRKTFPQ